MHRNYPMLLFVVLVTSLLEIDTGVKGSPWIPYTSLHLEDALWGSTYPNSIDIHKDTMVVGTRGGKESGQYRPGAVHVYTLINGVWSFETKLTTSAEKSAAMCGISLSVYEDKIVVGCPSESLPGTYATGAAYLFQRRGSVWTQIRRFLPESQLFRLFSWKVLVAQDYIFIVDPFAKYGGSIIEKGSLCRFHFTGGDWQGLGCTSSADGEPTVFYGYSIAFSNPYLAVGVPGSLTQIAPGYVNIYNIQQDWQLTQKLTGNSYQIVGDLFGIFISMSDDFMAVTAPHQKLGDGRMGVVYVYTLSSLEWKFQSLLKPKQHHENLIDGYIPSLSKVYMDISDNQNSIWSFSFNGNDWIEKSDTEGFISIIEKDARFRVITIDDPASHDTLFIDHNPLEFTHSKIPTHTDKQETESAISTASISASGYPSHSNTKKWNKVESSGEDEDAFYMIGISTFFLSFAFGGLCILGKKYAERRKMAKALDTVLMNDTSEEYKAQTDDLREVLKIKSQDAESDYGSTATVLGIDDMLE